MLHCLSVISHLTQSCCAEAICSIGNFPFSEATKSFGFNRFEVRSVDTNQIFSRKPKNGLRRTRQFPGLQGRQEAALGSEARPGDAPVNTAF